MLAISYYISRWNRDSSSKSRPFIIPANSSFLGRVCHHRFITLNVNLTLKTLRWWENSSWNLFSHCLHISGFCGKKVCITGALSVCSFHRPIFLSHMQHNWHYEALSHAFLFSIPSSCDLSLHIEKTCQQEEIWNFNTAKDFSGFRNVPSGPRSSF